MLSTYTNSCALVNCKYRVLPKCPVRYHGMALTAFQRKILPSQTHSTCAAHTI